ncbi:MAG: carbamoyltransferase HypF [Sulfolobales archaeon]|nr:carbamoyltransferase HypF [Sulfolobales archaeon]MDW8083335.1 carbamoyltransferase HypF [Sulfolobales archaeon]
MSGLVQGVGFRPYVHSLAKSLKLGGYVKNVGGSEVEIVVEGDRDSVSLFLYKLLLDTPKPAEVEHVVIEEVHQGEYLEFKIEKSSGTLYLRSMLPPDFSICDECLREVLDPRDRRHSYPFNSCVWCGPRFSMMYSVPYDRNMTSMRDFPLCPDCAREYTDIENRRRYHAQGISCPKCGPRAYLYTRNLELLDVDEPIHEAAKLISEGYIVGVKGVGGYHIACLATDDDVVLRLRQRKKRPTKPFAVMTLDIDIADRLVVLDDISRNLLLSPQRPIVLLLKRESSPVSKYVSPGMAHEGVFLPYTALHYILLRDVRDRFAVMTSGNVTDEPMCYNEKCAIDKLSKIADFILTHNRVIVNRVDDSVIRFTDGSPILLRRSRGYVPQWIRIPFRLSVEAVAMGADIISAPAVAFEDRVVLTQYIGELGNGETMSEFLKYLRYFTDVYRVDSAKAVYVVDKHPRYISRAIGVEMSENSGKLVEIQHHTAHILSTMADANLLGESYIGVATDGVGYGDDGAIWGCEVIEISRMGYRRLGKLSYVKLSGSDRDVEYPARVLASYLTRILSEEEVISLYEKSGLVKTLPGGNLELEIFLRTVKKNWIYSSSLGRFLDAISVLLGVAVTREYEGSPAIRLEEAAYRGSLLPEADFADELVHVGEVIEIDPIPLIERILKYASEGRPQRDIAYTAQYVIGRAIGRAILTAARGKRVSRLVPAGGGAIVNSIIVRGVKDELKSEEFVLVLPTRIPPNDGGIALGQIYSLAYIANIAS